MKSKHVLSMQRSWVILRWRAAVLCVSLLSFAVTGASCSQTADKDIDGVVAKFTSHVEWGPCKPEQRPCVEEYVATRDGALQQTTAAGTRTAQLNATSAGQFVAFLDSQSLKRGIADSGSCHAATADRSETVTIDFEDGRKLSKNVLGCSGEPYDSIQVWSSRFRALF